MNLEDLKAPFYASEIEWRIGRCGQSGERVWATVLAYVTNRAIMDRLDAVCGPANWRNEFKQHPCSEKAVLCGISIKVGEEWVTKWDGADSTDIEAAKGVLSDSMKRAAVQWSIGRFLYNLDEGFLDDSHISTDKRNGWNRGKTKEGKMFWWCPPELPEWALPKAKDPEWLVSVKTMVQQFAEGREDKFVAWLTGGIASSLNEVLRTEKHALRILELIEQRRGELTAWEKAEASK